MTITVPIGWDTQVLIDIANLLADAGTVGLWLPAGWDTPPADPVITVKHVPADPDRVVAVMWVNSAGETKMPHERVQFQIRTRGAIDDEDDADNLATAAYQLLHGRDRYAPASGHIYSAFLSTGVRTSLGRDGNGRREHIDEYFVEVDLPSTPNRTE